MQENPPHFKRNETIVVFSHLRWNFVTQRPQHLMKPLAQKRDIVFVEEPLPPDPYEPSYTIRDVFPGIKVVQVRAESISDRYYQTPAAKIVTSLVDSRPTVLWLYSPSFIPFTKLVSYELLVYDCMDELAAFKGASTLLKNQEKELLKNADLVFTGGVSLYKAKRKSNLSTYCFPSSVDVKHFSNGNYFSKRIPSDMKSVSKPVVGFYGVLDERLDQNLLQEIALKMPEISFVLIGPVVKIDPHSLPKANNLHYLGQKNYDELPNYLRCFDIAFMPFALNESTRFISPTKTLEFMAANKPIISTAITDVVSSYSHIASIVNNADELKQAVTNFLNESKEAEEIRLQAQAAVLAKTSWKRTAKAMDSHISRLMLTHEIKTDETPVNLGRESTGKYV